MRTHRLTLALLLAACNAAAQAGTWSDLWTTREQRGQHALDANHPTEAAALFGDARRRAYAQLQAGQYAKATELLKPFKDASSQYNRGNALAHTGNLREALAAYDAALAASPDDKDVIRNRDLIKQALEQQKRAGQQNGGGGQSPSGSQGSQSQADDRRPTDGQQAGKHTQPGSQSQAGGQQQSGGQAQANNRSPDGGNSSQSSAQSQAGSQQQSGDRSQANSPSPAAAQSRAAGQSQSGNQSQAGNSAQSAGAADNASASGSALSRNTQPGNPQSSSSPGAESAQRDAAAGLQYQQDQQSRATAGGTKSSGSDRLSATEARARGRADATTEAPPQPPSEQSLALDQWLRGIPEDSGELLRRKFLIEHMMQQERDGR